MNANVFSVQETFNENVFHDLFSTLLLLSLNKKWTIEDKNKIS